VVKAFSVMHQITRYLFIYHKISLVPVKQKEIGFASCLAPKNCAVYPCVNTRNHDKRGMAIKNIFHETKHLSISSARYIDGTSGTQGDIRFLDTSVSL
jgi:hypothetical protein